MTILIVGLGSIALKHIQAIRQIDQNAVIYALRSNRNAEEKEAVINLYSFEALKTIEFDFAIISNPTSEHKKTIELLLELNCPLFIEKPLSNQPNMKDTVLKAERKGILTYIACNLRFLDSLQYLKKELETSNKTINEVNVYCGSYLPDWRPGIDYRTTYSACKELGGGVHIDLIHEVDYVYWLFGQPNKVRKIFRNKSSLHIDAIDYANYCMEYDNYCVQIVLNYYRRDYKRTMDIVFEDNSWLVDLKQNNISSGSGCIFGSKQQISDTYLPQMAYFYHLIRTKSQTSFNSIKDADSVLQICLSEEND